MQIKVFPTDKPSISPCLIWVIAYPVKMVCGECSFLYIDSSILGDHHSLGQKVGDTTLVSRFCSSIFSLSFQISFNMKFSVEVETESHLFENVPVMMKEKPSPLHWDIQVEVVQKAVEESKSVQGVRRV